MRKAGTFFIILGTALLLAALAAAVIYGIRYFTGEHIAPGGTTTSVTEEAEPAKEDAEPEENPEESEPAAEEVTEAPTEVDNGPYVSSELNLRRGDDGLTYAYRGDTPAGDYIGFVRGDDGTYFVWRGILDQSFTGVAQSGSEYWYCSHGKVDTSFNGSFQQDGYTYNVVNGKATLA